MGVPDSGNGIVTVVFIHLPGWPLISGDPGEISPFYLHDISLGKTWKDDSFSLQGLELPAVLTGGISGDGTRDPWSCVCHKADREECG